MTPIDEWADINDIDDYKLGYRWWTMKAWKWGVKLGPVTFHGYRWFDKRVRFAMCTRQREYILFGGPLT